MNENMLKITFLHPFTEEKLVMDLPSDTTFKEISSMLCKQGFITKKKGGYQFIVENRLVSQNEPLSTYAYTGSEMEVMIHGLLTVLT